MYAVERNIFPTKKLPSKANQKFLTSILLKHFVFSFKGYLHVDNFNTNHLSESILNQGRQLPINLSSSKNLSTTAFSVKSVENEKSTLSYITLKESVVFGNRCSRRLIRFIGAQESVVKAFEAKLRSFALDHSRSCVLLP